MGVDLTITQSLSFAEAVLKEYSENKKLDAKLSHSYNYLNAGRGAMTLRATQKSIKPPAHNTNVIYSVPGQARPVEMCLPEDDTRAGVFPVHNSVGAYPEDIELRDAVRFEDYRGLMMAEDLMSAGFEKREVFQTKKRFYDISQQFIHLNAYAYKQLYCIDLEDNRKQDFELYYRKEEAEASDEIQVAFVNPSSQLIHWMQVVTKDKAGQVIRMIHVSYDIGEPIVVNETVYDSKGNLRNIAHVGTTGAASNTFKNSLERYDDGTILWTVSCYEGKRVKTGAAAMKEDGTVALLSGGSLMMAKNAARNMGAEKIGKDGAWTGKFGRDACVAELQDKYVMRQEYKQAVRRQSNQIIDGASIPGLIPIFNI